MFQSNYIQFVYIQVICHRRTNVTIRTSPNVHIRSELFICGIFQTCEKLSGKLHKVY